MDNALPERVRQVIQTSGLSQTEFADRIATTPDKLSKSLSGNRKFTTTELALTAQIAGSTVEWLLNGEHRATPAIAARTALAAAPSHDEIAKSVSRFSDASEQISLLAEESRELTPLPALARTTRYVEQANKLADDASRMVRAAGLDQVTGVDLPEIIESVFSVDVAVVDLPGNTDGCAWQTPDQRLIVLNRTPHWARQRFTLAHELGHILACDAQNLIAEEVPPHSSQISEKRANTFAASFLMPDDEIRKLAEDVRDMTHFSDLVSRFRVSPESMAWRLVNLDLMQKDDVKLWTRQTAEACALVAGRPELVSVERNKASGIRLPPRIVDEHLKYFYAGETSAMPLAALLDMTSREVVGMLRPSEAY